MYADQAIDLRDWGLLQAVMHGPDVSQPVAYKLDCLNFSAFIGDQDPNRGDTVTDAQVRERLKIIAPMVKGVRTFSTTNGHQHVCPPAREQALKIYAGAWLGPSVTANELEIAGLIGMAKAGCVDIAIVGSEALLRRDVTADQLIAYINRVKQALPGIPVTTADTYHELLSYPNVIAACDVFMVNYYPYWEGVSLDYAVASIHLHHQQVVRAAGGKRVIVSETGWPTCGNTIGNAVPSPENAKFYLLDFVSWARDNRVEYCYFETFDELWKARYEGPQGACWGLWEENGQIKPGIGDAFCGTTVPDNWSGTGIPGGPGECSIQFTYVPPYGSFENLRGQVWHVAPADYKVAVYINVGGGWWTKPYFAYPLTDIYPDGSFVCDITTGGVDQEATSIRAYLVPVGYNPPLTSGQGTLPQELGQNACTQTETIRQP